MAMQFTPQQLAGGPKFSPVTRIGNWQEELAMEQSKIENFRKRSETGSLSLRKLETKIAVCTEIVPHTYSADGMIRFGDSVILQHDSSSSVLACDPFEIVPITNETVLVTTVEESPQPKARNTFRILRPPRALQNLTDDESDPILRVGQPFLLACNESLLVLPGANFLAPTLYLSSTRKTERTATKRTNRQMVFMSTVLDADAVWFANIPSQGKANGVERFLRIGSPVSISTSYQLTHRQTNMFLTCDPKNKTPTEFGIEYECYADRSTAYGKIALMVSEYKGSSTSQTLTKPDAPNFSWHFVVSQEERRALDSRQLPPAATSEIILQQLQEFIRSRGVDAFWNLRETLRTLERKMVTAGKIDRDDLIRALGDWGVTLSAKYLDRVIDLVDVGKMGLVDIRDFLRLVRGTLPSHRLKVLKEVFAVLDQPGEGVISLMTLKASFQGLDHPLVSMGEYSEEQALEHLVKNLDVSARAPNRITFEIFADYYADLSAAVDDDDYFAAVVRSNFGVRSGK